MDSRHSVMDPRWSLSRALLRGEDDIWCVPCPSKDWPQRTRVAHVLALAKAYNVQGAIVVQQKFCDPHELDIPALTKALNQAGIKTLFLEFDVTVPIGQFRVRVEAFLEMLQEDDLF